MGFNAVYVNPFHYPGFSGSLYAVKDYYRLNPRFQGEARADGDRLLRDFTSAAEACRLRVIMDLVVNHTSKDSELVARHPEWFAHDESGEIRSPFATDPADPRRKTVWGDLAELDYDGPQRDPILAYFQDVVRHYLELGFAGFRCDAAYKVPAEVWRTLTDAAKAAAPEALFCAETVGAPKEAVLALADAGFDYLYNSVKWWDFKSPWLLEQYEAFRHIAPSIGFPESHDTPRLVTELRATGAPEDEIEPRYRQAYAFAAAFSSGVLMPMGFEYGWGRRLAVVTGRDEAAEPKRFDLSLFVAEINAMKLAIPALNEEGPQRLLPSGDDRWWSWSGAPRPPTTAPASSSTATAAGARELNTRASTVPPGKLRAWSSRSASRSCCTLDQGRRAQGRDASDLWRPDARIADRGCLSADRLRPLSGQADRGRDLRGLGRCVSRRPRQIARRPQVPPRGRGLARDALSFFDNDRWVARVSHSTGSGCGGTRSKPGPTASRAGARKSKRNSDAGQDISLELAEGRALVEEALPGAEASDAAAIHAVLRDLAAATPRGGPSVLRSSTAARELMARARAAARRRRGIRASSRWSSTARPRALPRGTRCSRAARGRRAGQERHLRRLHRAPAGDRARWASTSSICRRSIRSAGSTARAATTARRAQPGDPGSPYAIGAAEGGHGAIDPELGTLADFRRFVAPPRPQGMEVALDFAVQCAPDHPWVREHPEWFRFRPDGSIKYAENPPKKYQDIVNVDFDSPKTVTRLWAALRDVVLFWVGEGVRIFRVDNPHTKPVPFWEWLIREVKARCPEAIFLAEAFTRPKMMQAPGQGRVHPVLHLFHLAQHQARADRIPDRADAGTRRRNIFRPNFFTNTPDILPVFLQEGGRPAFRIRAGAGRHLVARLRHLQRLRAVRERRRCPAARNISIPRNTSTRSGIGTAPATSRTTFGSLNRFRRANPALQEFANLRFLACDDRISWLTRKSRPIRPMP